jgi:hypothetical protein
MWCWCAREIEVRGFACELSTAGVRWRPTGARGSRGARGAGQRGGATVAGKVRVTHGE